MAGKALDELTKDQRDLEVEKIDILTNLRKAIDNKITMIPCFEINEDKLSGLFISKQQISAFIKKNRV